jgi:hypothetical protein
MTTATRLLLVALLSLLSVAECFGSHLVAGEISCQHDTSSANPFTYYFTLTLYRDTKGVDQPNATLDFGVGGQQSVPVGLRDRVGIPVAEGIEKLVYTFKYAYPGPGTYFVRFTEENRNAGIVNMFQSVNTAFHIESQVTVSAALRGNSSPQLLNPPIFQAFVGQKVCINPAAYDAENDSLSYRLVTPLAKSGVPVASYQRPDLVAPRGTSESGGEPAFTLNALTGELCWDSPGPRKRDGGVISTPDDFGQYAVAFEVEEWRQGVKIGSTVRDFAIFVTAPGAPKPELRAENAAGAGFDADRLVRAEPGRPVTFSVLYKASAAARDSLRPVGETFLLARRASATTTDSAGFVKVTYTWTPTAAERRGHPYVIVFRGESGKALRNDLTFGVFVGADIPVGQVTATEDEVDGRKVRLFPNPARNRVRLAGVPGTGVVCFRLTDALGREVYASPNLQGTTPEVDLAPLPNGLYAYTITTGQRLLGKGRLLKR